MKPILLDTFCKAGGCTKGYQRAGFYVVGVDIEPQPRYCGDEFVQADAFEYVREHGHRFDVIHASPPCQRFSNASKIHGVGDHKDLLTPIRKVLEQIGKPWIIENVPGAPMHADIIMCGSIVGERRLRRHRLFELWKPVLWLVPPCQHQRKTVSVFGHGGHRYHGVAEWREVMGIDWMTRDELSQAIPPAYTEWLGKQLLRVVGGGTGTV